ncbi:MAG: 50S ribosome-binding GTPase, partial [Coleofasciculus sp. S288]|nr:50S ribosome-binding GTPase [Coleofasciculus sp. S288]
MALPIVAVIGRPNVGKSTLVNRLAGVTDAIVHDEPGVTRDRTYRPAFWLNREFQIVDTGGLVFHDDTEFLPLIREQAMAALSEASAAILVVDGQTGPTGGDEAIAEWLRQHPVPVLLAVNKCESPQQGIIQAADFWNLGLGEPFPVSAIHGGGTGELL